jgi:hypothetical protein
MREHGFALSVDPHRAKCYRTRPMRQRLAREIQMLIQPAQPQSIGGVLDTTFQLYKASVIRMIPMSLLAIVASSPSTIYILAKGYANSGNPLAMLAMIEGPGYMLSLFATYVGALLMASASSIKMAAIGAGTDVPIGSALMKGLTRLPALVLALVLFSIAVTIGTLLLVIPGIILSVSLLLFVGTCVFDNKGPVACLLASHRLVWGNWWRTVAILVVGFIVLIVIYLLALLVISIVTPLATIGAGTENLMLISLVMGVAIGALVGLFMTPFYLALFLAIYWDLKLRKEGSDLAARVGALNPA